MKLCILCELRPREVPDREAMGRPIKRVCSECHRARLRGDLQKILAERDKRRAVSPTETQGE
jgi:hypothetical protein